MEPHILLLFLPDDVYMSTSLNSVSLFGKPELFPLPWEGVGRPQNMDRTPARQGKKKGTRFRDDPK